MRVGAQRVRKKPSAPVNFPSTTVVSETGEVSRVSSVPDFLSSAKRRIVMIGTTNRLKIQKYVFVKRNGSAWPFGAPGEFRKATIAAKIIPFMTRNAARITYASGERK